MEAIEKAAEILASSDRLVALTGAGLSTESGIPDYRGPQGVWTKDPAAEKLSHISFYMSDPDIRVRAWETRLDHPIWQAEPNPGHTAFVDLEHLGLLDLLVTQNVDGLHRIAGTSPDRLIEIHGTAREVMCMSCSARAPMEGALERVRLGEKDPACRSCGGILKSATVSFGQSLDPDDLDRAFAAAETCDVFLAAGTSLEVYPIAHMAALAKRSGASVLIFNAGPTGFDHACDVKVTGQLGEALPELVRTLNTSGAAADQGGAQPEDRS